MSRWKNIGSVSQGGGGSGRRRRLVPYMGALQALHERQGVLTTGRSPSEVKRVLPRCFEVGDRRRGGGLAEVGEGVDRDGEAGAGDSDECV